MKNYSLRNFCKFITVILLCVLCCNPIVLSQNIAITDEDGYNPHSSAMLDVKSTTKGMLVPRLSSAERNAIGGAATGLLVFDTDQSNFYYWSGSEWKVVGSGLLNYQNGLTQSGTTVKLGGALTESSTITQGSYSMNFNMTGTGDFNVLDNGTSALFVRDDGNVGIGSITPMGKLEVKADVSAGVNDPLFSVISYEGDTVFAVYPEGVRISVSDGAKGAKGGFAVGGFAGKGNGQELLMVTPDSIRMYVERDGGKGAKGGFAVGGFSAAKDVEPMEFFRVTPDSVRVYLDETAKGKGSKGGFAVGGFSASKDTITDFLRVTSESTRVSMEGDGGFKVGQIAAGTTEGFLNLTPMNYFIGHESGINTTIGQYNSFIGYQTGKLNTSGYSNIFIGYHSGLSNTSGNRNIFLGNECGINNTTGYGNIFLGVEAGYSNQDGYRNIFMGFRSGHLNVSGDDNLFFGSTSGSNNLTGAYNVFVGSGTGCANTSGNSNTFIGHSSGNKNKTGFGNTFVGRSSGYSDTTSNYNTFMGFQSGRNLKSGTRNVFLGYYSGGADTTGSYNVFVGGMAGGSKKKGSYNVMIGDNSGRNNIEGQYNVFIGYMAGENETGSNLLYIDNSDTDSPLIYGEFNNDLLVFNADVGIGTSPSTEKLEVDGAIKIGTASGTTDGTIRWTGTDFEGRKVGSWVSLTSEGDGHSLDAADGSPVNVVYVDNEGEVGIGTTDPLSKLDIRGDAVRIWDGLANIDYATGQGDLYVEDVLEVDNDIYVSDYVSALGGIHVGGTSDPEGNLIVDGNVAIGTSTITTRMHVVRAFGGNELNPSSHVALIENSSTSTLADVLALKIGITGDPLPSNNFITFFNGNDDAVGAIEGDNLGGITYKSGSADYAEYLPIENHHENFEEGDIIGVFGGKISKKTTNAEFVSAISTNPIVLGNDPGEEKVHLYEMVGFVGMVPVKVRGKVHSGDYIIASMKNDGMGVAVALDDLPRDQYNQIVGIAWESSDVRGVKLIKTAIGVSSWTAPMQQQQKQITNLTKQNKTQQKLIEELKRENRDMKSKFERIDDLQEQIDQLKGMLDE